MRRKTAAVAEITFRVLAPDEETGQQWITCQASPRAEEMVIGYIRPRGDGFEARGSGEGWPLISICADPTRALCAVIGAWGEQVASGAEDEEEEGLNS